MKATGDDNDSEAYMHKQFDVSPGIGIEYYIKVVDDATDGWGWGHINLDNIIIPIEGASQNDFANSKLHYGRNETGT